MVGTMRNGSGKRKQHLRNDNLVPLTTMRRRSSTKTGPRTRASCLMTRGGRRTVAVTTTSTNLSNEMNSTTTVAQVHQVESPLELVCHLLRLVTTTVTGTPNMVILQATVAAAPSTATHTLSPVRSTATPTTAVLHATPTVLRTVALSTPILHAASPILKTVLASTKSRTVRAI